MDESQLTQEFLSRTEYDYAAIDQYYRSELPCAMDHTFAHLCERYRQAETEVRCQVSQSMAGSRTSWLTIFAHRMAMTAVHQRSKGMLQDALTALIIVAQGADRHEFLMTLSLVHQSATKLGKAKTIFEEVAVCACNPESAQMLLDFTKRRAKDKRIEAMGYRDRGEKNRTLYVFGNQAVPAAWL